MGKIAKKQNWELGTSALQNLVAADFDVQAFSDIHFRINKRLDVWPSTRRWYDTRSRKGGVYDELETFAKKYFAAIPTARFATTAQRYN